MITIAVSFTITGSAAVTGYCKYRKREGAVHDPQPLDGLLRGTHRLEREQHIELPEPEEQSATVLAIADYKKDLALA
jgi:hypothetical protein